MTEKKIPILWNDFPVNHLILEDAEFKKLSISAKCLYFFCCKHKNRLGRRKEWFWHSIKQFSEDTGMHMQTVKKAKRELLDSKFIETKKGAYLFQGRRAPNYYRVKKYSEVLACRNQNIDSIIENRPLYGQKRYRMEPENVPIIKNDTKNKY